MGKRRRGIGKAGRAVSVEAPAAGPSMCLVSASFADGEALPMAHTGDGGNLSPPLAWGDVPRAARSLVLLFDGPDPTGRPGPPFAHWILYNLQPSAGGLELAADQTGLPPGCGRGRNDFGRTLYVGPVLDFGRYEYGFRLFALDAMLDPRALGNATWKELARALEPHLLAEAAELACFVERAATGYAVTT
jgi:Raf kinase inhibitor-like YbhB/YbcL family protein